MWVLEGQIGIFLNPNDVICLIRSTFKYSTKNEDFFPSLHFRFSIFYPKNENVVMGKNLHFWSKYKNGTSDDR